MTNFEIIATPTTGKKIEFEQSITSIQKKLQKISPLFKIRTAKEGNYKFSFAFETEEETNRLLESDGFILLAGAIKTLCKKHSLVLNDKKQSFNLINCKNLLNIKDYIKNKNKGVTYAN